jgi:hypothetical protein
MSYTAEISRANPSCFLFLIDQSGSMADSFGGEPDKRKADKVADVINRLLQNLVNMCAKSEGVRNYYDVGVIGYGLSVGPAFGGSLKGRGLVPISETANSPARIEQRTQKIEDGTGGLVAREVKFPVWFEATANGATPMGEALRYAHQLLQGWVANHPSSYPPTVINITDGEATDGDPTVLAQELTSLSTDDGSVLLFNCHISTFASNAIVFPDTDVGLPDDYAHLLFCMSSVLPDKMREAVHSQKLAKGEQPRGFAFNTDLATLISFLEIGTRPSNLR